MNRNGGLLIGFVLSALLLVGAACSTSTSTEHSTPPTTPTPTSNEAGTSTAPTTAADTTTHPTTTSAGVTHAEPPTTIHEGDHIFVGDAQDPEPYTSTSPPGLFFSSADGAYMCGILAGTSSTDDPDAGTAGCQGETTPVPPRPADCPEGGPGWGFGMQVDQSGEVRFLCTGGVIYGTNDGPGRALQTGQTLTSNGFTCLARTDGISCVHRSSGHGFSIATDWNATF